MSYSKGKCNETALVRKFIGSAYDHVKFVSENLDEIQEVAKLLESLVSVDEHLADINAVANALEDYRVSEVIELEEGQQTITTQLVVASACDIRVFHPKITPCLLDEGADYEKTESNVVTLKRTYPTGTKVMFVQYVTKDDIGSVEVDSFSINKDTGALELRSQGTTFSVTLPKGTDGTFVDLQGRKITVSEGLITEIGD